MNLKEFVTQTISETVNGMEEAAKLTGRRVRFSKDSNGINFDIAFVIEDTATKEGGGGLNIQIVSVGGKAGSVSTSTSTQRMKFTVEVGNLKKVEEDLEEATEQARIEEIRRKNNINHAI